MNIEKLIQGKAYELGYEKCGIIPINMLEGYKEKVEERIRKVPESEPFYRMIQLENPQKEYPWAKSVIVLVVPYGNYKIPEPVRGHIATAYLFDTRVDTNIKEYQYRLEMEKYLNELGLKAVAKPFGLVALRWAALQAGIGIIRRNNFLYTQSGSWVQLEAWLIDGGCKIVCVS